MALRAGRGKRARNREQGTPDACHLDADQHRYDHHQRVQADAMRQQAGADDVAFDLLDDDERDQDQDDLGPRALKQGDQDGRDGSERRSEEGD